MNEPSKKPDVQQSYAKERAAFKALLLSNPNYFGNLSESQFKPILPICCNQHYETLKDVGYHPQQKRLEAVVHVNQPSGYGGDVCANGSAEYVRFYLSVDDGKSWEDQGLTGFQAYDVAEIKDGRHLEYAASLAVDPKRRLCFLNPLIKVRAILSWNYPPPENQPYWRPVWGNVLQKDILVEPFRRIIWKEMIEVLKFELPPVFKEAVDLDEPVPTKQKALSAAELAVQYADQDVPPHRFAFKEIHQFVSGQTSLSAEAMTNLLPGMKIDPGIMDILCPKDGNTSYEELMSIGLDPNCPDTLVGVIKVKKMSGYSGGPCTQGSMEHVTFWADFDGNGSFGTCLGTASVQAYDLDDSPEQSAVPEDGVWYAARLPVDLDSCRRHCQKGPNLVPIRAILSWSVPAPCGNPNHVPAWGNRKETLICIAPKAGDVTRGKIGILGGIPVSMIDDSTGLTAKDAKFATNNLPPDSAGRPCPFGGRVTAQGAPLLGCSYKVEVVPYGGGAATAVVTDLMLTTAGSLTWTHKADPATGRFNYVPFEDNINGLLAQWDSTGDQLWTVRLTSFDANGKQVGGADEHLIQLDNTAPEAAIEITSGTGNCGKFKVGDKIEGRFAARDFVAGKDSLLRYQLSIEPDINHPAIRPNPNSGIVSTTDNWKLETVVETIVQTEKMLPCGYVIRVDVGDRTIVNSQSVGHWASATAGFCLEEPKE